MQRLTADLIHNSRAFYNPLKERQLDLRGYKLIVIENLGATEDQFDTLDMSDNEIKKLDNFPRSKRLRTLLLTNNHITRIDPRAGKNLATLQHLMLTNNRVANLSEIDALVAFPSLATLSLVDNPVTQRPNYRAYAIHKLPQLKVLDFRKIKPRERAAAEQLFASGAGQDMLTAVQAAQQEAQSVRALSACVCASFVPLCAPCVRCCSCVAGRVRSMCGCAGATNQTSTRWCRR